MSTTVKRRSSGGFTLVEALVASVILAAAVLVLCSLSTRCLSRVSLNQEYERAWQLLDQQLMVIKSVGLDEFIAEDITEGEVQTGPDQQDRSKYYWKIDLASEPLDQLYRVTLTIRWLIHNRWHEISAQTLLNA